MNFFDMYFCFWDFFCIYPWSISCFLSFIDLLPLFIFCVMSINPIIRYVENILYQSTTSLSAFYFALYLHRSLQQKLCMLSNLLVFSFLVSGFCILLRKVEPLTVYRALSVLFSHAALGQRDSVWYLVSPPEIRKRRVREGKWLISGHRATLEKT